MNNTKLAEELNAAAQATIAKIQGDLIKRLANHDSDWRAAVRRLFGEEAGDQLYRAGPFAVKVAAAEKCAWHQVRRTGDRYDMAGHMAAQAVYWAADERERRAREASMGRMNGILECAVSARVGG